MLMKTVIQMFNSLYSIFRADFLSMSQNEVVLRQLHIMPQRLRFMLNAIEYHL